MKFRLTLEEGEEFLLLLYGISSGLIVANENIILPTLLSFSGSFHLYIVSLQKTKV